MQIESARPMERLAFAALILFALSPIVVQGTWCPIARLSGTNANQLGLTFAALGVVAVTWLLHVALWHRGNAWFVPAGASIAAVLFGALIGDGPIGIGVTTSVLMAAGLSSAMSLPKIVARLPHAMDGLAAKRKITTALVVVLGLATILQISRISTFMGDHTCTHLSVVPSVPFVVKHSCLTAYVEAARLTTEDASNIYDAEHYPDLSHSERSATNQERYAPFSLDAYAYPPPFLLLPRLLLPLNDFLAQRALWFALNGLLIVTGLWTVASYIGGRHRLRVLLLAPLVLIGIPAIVTLQIGNVHAAVMVLAMLAMVAFESKRPALGGAMLAFAIASKISPGLLVIVLLFQRRFREVLWTAGFGLGFVLMGAAVVGPAPFKAFLTYQLPMLSSGKALVFLADDVNVPFNLAPFGIPFKLAFLGANVGDPWIAAKYINQVFTAISIGLTILAARKLDSPQLRVATWLAILTLGTLRSPFAPGYVMFTMGWLLSVTSTEVRSRKALIYLVVIWVVLSWPIPLPPVPLVLLSLTQQVIILALAMYWVFHKPVPKTT